MHTHKERDRIRVSAVCKKRNERCVFDKNRESSDDDDTDDENYIPQILRVKRRRRRKKE